MQNYPSKGILLQSYNRTRAHSTGYAQTQIQNEALTKPQHTIQSDDLYWAVRQIRLGNTKAKTKPDTDDLYSKKRHYRKTTSTAIQAFVPSIHHTKQSSSTHEPLADPFDDFSDDDEASTSSTVAHDKSTHRPTTATTANRSQSRGEQLLNVASSIELANSHVLKRPRDVEVESEIASIDVTASPSTNLLRDDFMLLSPVDSWLRKDSKRLRRTSPADNMFDCTSPVDRCASPSAGGFSEHTHFGSHV